MLERIQIQFTPAGETRTVTVRLPVRATENTRYPAMYLLDGQYFFPGEDGTAGRLDAFLTAAGINLIVFGIESAGNDFQRAEEYCLYDIPAPGHGTIPGHGSETAKWIAKELKPYLDSRYPTLPGREFTAVGGCSLGAAGALGCLLEQQDAFSRAMLLSPAVFPVLRKFVAAAEQEDLSGSRVWISWGSEEFAPTQLRMANAAFTKLGMTLQNAGAVCRLDCVPGGKHDRTGFEAQLPRALEYILQA